MELDTKTINNIRGKLERYSTTLNEVLKTKQGNFITRKAIQMEYNQTLELIEILK